MDTLEPAPPETPAHATAAANDAPPAPRRRRPASRRAAPGPVRRPKEEVETRRALAERARASRVPEADTPPPPRPGRSPGTPRLGRFVAGPAAKRSLGELTEDVLADLISELRANRRALLERIDSLYAAADGRPLTRADLDRLVADRRLQAHFRRVERENLRALLRQQRGFEPPIRRALGLSSGELRRLLAAHGLQAEALALKERTREEARAEAPLGTRLALACSKTEQLRDAGVLWELDERNLAELEAAVGAAATDGIDVAVVVELARRALGIDPRLWRRAAERYRLVEVAAGCLGVPVPAPAAEPRPAARHGGARSGTSHRRAPGGADRRPPLRR